MRRRLRCRAVAVLAAIAVVAGLAGCGVPTDRHPRAINREQVRDLLAPNTTAPSAGEQGPYIQHLFFVRDQRLQEVCRRGYTDDVRTLLDQLIGGPSDTERSAQLLTTFIPPGTRLLSLDLSSRGVLVIALSKEMDDLSGVSARNAYAQFVYTATALPGVSTVSFRSRGRLIEVPTAGRNKKAVTRVDYDASSSDGSGAASYNPGRCVP
ncbi:MAG TPA: GerMN domain-containing protein [Acidimicrobiales bacterium]|jgi:hypothetical protein|nr:GerMN domain-containing protein [Acidimicrobiales bacterium]